MGSERSAGPAIAVAKKLGKSRAAPNGKRLVSCRDRHLYEATRDRPDCLHLGDRHFKSRRSRRPKKEEPRHRGWGSSRQDARLKFRASRQWCSASLAGDAALLGFDAAYGFGRCSPKGWWPTITRRRGKGVPEIDRHTARRRQTKDPGTGRGPGSLGTGGEWTGRRRSAPAHPINDARTAPTE
jgi:hypothetical protein